MNTKVRERLLNVGFCNSEILRVIGGVKVYIKKALFSLSDC